LTFKRARSFVTSPGEETREMKRQGAKSARRDLIIDLFFWRPWRPGAFSSRSREVTDDQARA
jgi:hypothetical protein